jgi:predicted DNA-binding transcriptional regulator YafY
MSDTIQRHITMLSLIPAAPGKISARDLHSRLERNGFSIDIRSVERDLLKLSRTFPLLSDEARPAGWSWQSKESGVSFPRMDASSALGLELLAQYLKPLFPKSMLNQLEPEFQRARKVLADFAAFPIGHWSRSVAIIPFGQQLLPPAVAAEVLEVVYRALLEKRRFEASYRAVDSDKAKRYTVNPLGLVYRAGVVYLVGSLWDYEDVRHLALQRFSRPMLLDEPATRPSDFDFERHVREDRAFEFPEGRNVTLELRVEAWLGRHLSECRLSTDQEVNPIACTDDVRVTATVAETEQLVWWLRSLGPSVTVHKPRRLRDRMAADAATVAARYAAA